MSGATAVRCEPRNVGQVSAGASAEAITAAAKSVPAVSLPAVNQRPASKNIRDLRNNSEEMPARQSTKRSSKPAQRRDSPSGVSNSIGSIKRPPGPFDA